MHAPPQPNPDWLDRTDLAAWLRGSGDRILHANAAARALLGSSAPLGRSCRELVRCGGRDEEPLCAVCPLQARLRSGDPAACVGGLFVGRYRRRVDVLTLPLGVDRWLQVALPRTDEGRALRYLERVARRHRPVASRPTAVGDRLTPRQREILQRLADDEDPQAIARALHLSPVTVRNHVQHILLALGVHSIQEAVALFLLESPAQGG